MAEFDTDGTFQAIVQAEVQRIVEAANAAIEDGATADLIGVLQAKGWTCVPPFLGPVDGIAELAALHVIRTAGEEAEDGESPLAALGWIMGNQITYETALHRFTAAVIALHNAQSEVKCAGGCGRSSRDHKPVWICEECLAA